MANTKVKEPEAISMYNSGMSIQDVADFYGVTRQAMWDWLKRRGVEFRPQKRYGDDNHFHRGGKRKNKYVQCVVGRATKKGVVERKTACETCGSTPSDKNGKSSVEAHHDDYNKPLDIRWLCRKCHFAWHKSNKAKRRIVQKKKPKKL